MPMPMPTEYITEITTSTSARPGTLVESSGYIRSNDALKWKDIELYMVKHPEDVKMPRARSSS
jgi:hypothetical protein